MSEGHAGDETHCSGAGGCAGHGSCGGSGSCGNGHVPVLDARTIDPVIRQSAIFGVLIGLAPGAAVTIVSDQDPQPIAALMQERLPGSFEIDLDRAGEAEWRVGFARLG